MAEVVLHIEGREFGGWKEIRVTETIESLAGSFDLGVTNKWADQSEPWTIYEEDECTVLLDGEPVITGYVERRNPSFDPETVSLHVSGYDKAQALEANSALSRTIRNATALDVARQIAEPFGISVSLAPGIELSRIPRIVVHPGDTAHQVIQRAAKAAGVLAVSDLVGGLVLTRGETARTDDALIEGVNLISGSGEYDFSDRFYRYLIASQVPSTERAKGNAILGEAIDENVRRTDRVHWMRPERGLSREDARRRADWEARTRAARSEPVTVGVRGWLQSTGERWPKNAIAYIRSPILGVDGEMLISQVDRTLSEAGEITQLRLVRPDAFEPEPRRARVRRKGKGSGWKELRG